MTWLRRRGLLEADEAEPPAYHDDSRLGALDACVRGALGVGRLSSLPAAEGDEDSPIPKPGFTIGGFASRRARSARGFDIHAGVSPRSSWRFP